MAAHRSTSHRIASHRIALHAAQPSPAQRSSGRGQGQGPGHINPRTNPFITSSASETGPLSHGRYPVQPPVS